MSDEEFDASVDELYERIGLMIDGIPCSVIQVVLAELIFSTVDTQEEMNDVCDLLNEVAEDTGVHLSTCDTLH